VGMVRTFGNLRRASRCDFGKNQHPCTTRGIVIIGSGSPAAGFRFPAQQDLMTGVRAPIGERVEKLANSRTQALISCSQIRA